MFCARVCFIIYVHVLCSIWLIYDVHRNMYTERKRIVLTILFLRRNVNNADGNIF